MRIGEEMDRHTSAVWRAHIRTFDTHTPSVACPYFVNNLRDLDISTIDMPTMDASQPVGVHVRAGYGVQPAGRNLLRATPVSVRSEISQILP